MNRRDFLQVTALATTATLLESRRSYAEALPAQAIDIDLGAASTPFPHYWERCVGSDRAIVALREQWQNDLVVTHEKTGMQSVRCHGIFNDEMGVCTGDVETGLKFNFLYVDQVYDKMLELGVKPFVELSFMPAPLASSRNSIFFYRGNTSPPRVMVSWVKLITAFTEHLVERYGITEVRQWKFEVWNEPNIVFWAGSQAEYFDLYRATAQAIKKVDAGLMVGGPATAEIAWIKDFLDFCHNSGAPVDFVSTHVYADDPQELLFGKANLYPHEEVIPQALKKVNEQIRASGFPHLPLWLSEWSSHNPAFIAQTIRDCDGLAEAMSYWTFSNVFEELGVPSEFFNTSFGMMAQGGVPRPSLHAFTMLHRLGDVRVACSNAPALVTKRHDGTYAILLWNLIPQRAGVASAVGDPLKQTSIADAAKGEHRPFVVKLKGASGKHVRVQDIDLLRGSAQTAFVAMGKPISPTRTQIAALRKAAEMPPAATMLVSSAGELKLELAPNAVVLIEVPAHA